MANVDRILRFGIMCSGTTFSAWEASCIRKLLDLDGVFASLLIIDERKSSSPTSVGCANFGKSRSFAKLIWSVPPISLEPVALSEELSNVAKINCGIQSQAGISASLDDDVIEQIESANLDFILRFGQNHIRGAVLDVPRYGIWSFHFGDPLNYSYSPPSFWEIYDKNPITRAALLRLTDGPNGAVELKRGFFSTVSHSYKASLNCVLSDSAAWPAQVCLDIQNDNANYFNDQPFQVGAPIRPSPASWQVLVFLFRMWMGLLGKLFHVLFRHEEWNIGIIDAPISTFTNCDTLPEIGWLRNRAGGRFLADPFGYIDGNKNIILCEEFDYRSYRGVISELSGRDASSVIRSSIKFDEGYHLSYPYLLYDEGELYCIPEMSEAAQVKLYRATVDPEGWEEVAILISGFAAVDSTIVKHEGMWWLFCTNAEDGRYEKLHLWYSEKLLGPWTPHLYNPVKIDVRSARPGGTPFMFNGNLYRPAQDCSLTYGGRLAINRVTKMTKSGFEEEVCNTIGPDIGGKYCDGMHTLSQLGACKTLVDGKRHRFYLGGFWRALRFLGTKALSKVSL